MNPSPTDTRRQSVRTAAISSAATVLTAKSYARIIGANDLRSARGASARLRRAYREAWATELKALLT